MPKPLAKYADDLARYLRKHPGRDLMACLRDRVDILTGSELDCIALDILTDMVEARLKKESV